MVQIHSPRPILFAPTTYRIRAHKSEGSTSAWRKTQALFVGDRFGTSLISKPLSLSTNSSTSSPTLPPMDRVSTTVVPEKSSALKINRIR